jgi:hypothetical protein
VISLTPYGHVTERIYSYIQTSSYNDSSVIGGSWGLLSLQPGAGSTNVPRDTAIWIDEPRPVRVENLSLNPSVPVTIKSNDYVFSAFAAAYPTELLQPDTVYNVSAIVAGIPAWWTFSTSNGPHEFRFNTYLNPTLPWVALFIGVSVTFGSFLLCGAIKKNLRFKHYAKTS